MRIRDYNPLRDADFVMSSWVLSSLDRHASKHDADARRAQQEIARRTLAAGRCAVAVSADDDDALLGYAVAVDGRIAWCYVKLVFRGQGVARALAQALGCAWPDSSVASSAGQ